MEINEKGGDEAGGKAKELSSSFLLLSYCFLRLAFLLFYQAFTIYVFIVIYVYI